MVVAAPGSWHAASCRSCHRRGRYDTGGRALKAAVLGANGQLGRALCARLPEATPLLRTDLDIGDSAAVAVFDFSQFDAIINAAAFTEVDSAETPAGRATAWRVNAEGVAHLVRAANRHRVPLVHFSSEYVFDGRSDGPTDERAPMSPLSAYGASKAAGDLCAGLAERHQVVRTTWVIGDGRNFVRTMIGLARRGVDPAVVCDQLGRLTFADDLATAVVHLLTTATPSGTYNVTNTGAPASWAEVARLVFELDGHDGGRVDETTTAAYFADKPGAAKRPLNSVLELSEAAAVGIWLPGWRQRLAEYVTEVDRHS